MRWQAFVRNRSFLRRKERLRQQSSHSQPHSVSGSSSSNSSSGGGGGGSRMGIAAAAAAAAGGGGGLLAGIMRAAGRVDGDAESDDGKGGDRRGFVDRAASMTVLRALFWIVSPLAPLLSTPSSGGEDDRRKSGGFGASSASAFPGGESVGGGGGGNANAGGIGGNGLDERLLQVSPSLLRLSLRLLLYLDEKHALFSLGDYAASPSFSFGVLGRLLSLILEGSYNLLMDEMTRVLHRAFTAKRSSLSHANNNPSSRPSGMQTNTMVSSSSETDGKGDISCPRHRFVCLVVPRVLSAMYGVDPRAAAAMGAQIFRAGETKERGMGQGVGASGKGESSQIDFGSFTTMIQDFVESVAFMCNTKGAAASAGSF